MVVLSGTAISLFCIGFCAPSVVTCGDAHGTLEGLAKIRGARKAAFLADRADRKLGVDQKMAGLFEAVAVDILQDFEVLAMTHNGPYTFEEIWAIVQKHVDSYGLCEDPFTRMICTSKEYAENSLEYDRQIMMDLYGHCDGLE